MPGPTPGHLLFLAAKPVTDDFNVFPVRVCDSGAEPHFENIRGEGEGESESGASSGSFYCTVDDWEGPKPFNSLHQTILRHYQCPILSRTAHRPSGIN
jgi:hypothetical protein